MRSAALSFSRDKGTDLLDSAGIEYVARLEPSAPGSPYPEVHLAGERLHAVAVAVDDHGDACGNGAACKDTVHVEMAGSAIDLHRGSSLCRCRKQPIEVDRVAIRSRRRAVRRVRNDVDERMVDSAQITFRETVPVVAA